MQESPKYRLPSQVSDELARLTWLATHSPTAPESLGPLVSVRNARSMKLFRRTDEANARGCGWTINVGAA